MKKQFPGEQLIQLRDEQKKKYNSFKHQDWLKTIALLKNEREKLQRCSIQQILVLDTYTLTKKFWKIL